MPLVEVYQELTNTEGIAYTVTEKSKVMMDNREKITQDAADAIDFFNEEAILFHMTMGIDAENREAFEKAFHESMTALRTLLSAYKESVC